MIYKSGHYEPVAREGIVFIIPLLLASLIAWCWNQAVFSAILVVACIAVALFFRNPERRASPPEGLVSPADGTIVDVIENTMSESLGNVPVKRISIFMSVFNVHVNRIPTDGIIRRIRHSPGKFLDARNPLASAENERCSVVIETEAGLIEVVQIAGLIARRICTWVGNGDKVFRGQRFGLIRFGSRVDIYVPESISFVVKKGTRVKAGTTIIAVGASTQNNS
jgi:phosphatidylserine decarboxylase